MRFDRYGDIDELEVRDVEDPVAAPDGVVVQVLATGINPGETMIRQGLMASDDDVFPMGEGSDLAGRIVSVGERVSGWTPGDEVFGWTDERAAHAQLVAVPATQIATKPEAAPWDQVGSLYVAGGTAAAMRRAADVDPDASPGSTVVVTAAAGGVGSILVQLLVADGLRVIGVAGPDNDDYLQGLGAETVHRGEDLEARLREATPDGVVAFLDCFGQGYTDLGLALDVPPEKVVTIADFERAPENGARVVYSYQEMGLDDLVDLSERIAAGRLTVPIAAVFPLEQVREAYSALATRRTRGKIVLHPAE